MIIIKARHTLDFIGLDLSKNHYHFNTLKALKSSTKTAARESDLVAESSSIDENIASMIVLTRKHLSLYLAIGFFRPQA